MVTGDDNQATPPAITSRAWLITFTDLVSLMLTFFVMLFAMSSVKVDRWESTIDSLSQTLNPSRVQTVSPATAQFNIGTIFRRRAINLDYLAAVLDETIREEPLLAEAQIMTLEDRLIVSLPGDLLFEPARAELSDEARQALSGLGGLLRNIGNQIGVDGHTDPQPPAGEAYPSNWELSLARATAVANALKAAGYNQSIVTFGFADSRYQQLPNLDASARRAMARRVDVVVLPDVADE